MADIFVSYKSEDRERARLVAQALQAEGFDVWWDPALQAGEDFQEVIDRNLREALVVVVLWSPLSVKSRWVRSEATIGDRFGALAPAMIEACDLPTAFVLVQTADISAWRGDRGDASWREFTMDLAAKRDKRRAERIAHTATPAPDAGAIETIFWQSIKDSADTADFQSYVKRYPNGHFTDLAENRLASLGSARAATGAANNDPPRRNNGAERGDITADVGAVAPTEAMRSPPAQNEQRPSSLPHAIGKALREVIVLLGKTLFVAALAPITLVVMKRKIIAWLWWLGFIGGVAFFLYATLIVEKFYYVDHPIWEFGGPAWTVGLLTLLSNLGAAALFFSVETLKAIGKAARDHGKNLLSTAHNSVKSVKLRGAAGQVLHGLGQFLQGLVRPAR